MRVTEVRSELRGLRVLAALVVFVVPLLHGCGESRQPTEAAGTTLVVGVDGLEWDVLLPLLRQGRLPHIAALIERGRFGELGTVQPTLSPIIWTTVATGKTLDKHGIRGFAELDANRQPRLFDNTDRRTKAIWNMVSEAGLRVGVVGWWMTFPVEPVNGVMVAQTNTTDQLRIAHGRHVWKGTLLAGVSGQVHPQDREAEVMARLEHVESNLERRVDEIFGAFPHPLSALAERLWSNCMWAFRADATYLEVAGQLLREDEPYDLFMVYFGGPDVVGHRFWRYHDPDLYDHPPARGQVENLGGVIDAYYEYIDAAVGELVDAAGADARVLLISDHGMQPVNRGARFDPDDPPRDVNSAHHLEAPPGVVIAAGPGIVPHAEPVDAARLQRGDLGRPLSVLDVAPTLLALLGLPVGADMDGVVATDLLEPGLLREHPPRTLASWDTDDWIRDHRSRQAADREEAERLEQLRSLGYVQ